MLQAMNTGHDGSLTTVHANSPRDALVAYRDDGADGRLRPARARDPAAGLPPRSTSIVHLERLEDGSRRVTAITEVQRMESEVITLQDIFEFKIEEITSDGVVVGSLQPTGLRPTFLSKFEKRGIDACLSACSWTAEAQRGQRSRPGSAREAALTFRRCLSSRLVSAPRSVRRPPSRRHGVQPHGRPGGTTSRTAPTCSRCPPSTALRPARSSVRENGQVDVGRHGRARPGGRTGQFGVVLVIDASNSMQGDAMQGAVIAARAFAARPSRRSAPRRRRPSTRRRTVLASAHDRPGGDRRGARRLSRDARATGRTSTTRSDSACRMLEARGTSAAPAIVVLSDGADTGSVQSPRTRLTAEPRRMPRPGLHRRAALGGLRPDALQRAGAGTGGGQFSRGPSPDGSGPDLRGSLGSSSRASI